MNIQAIAFDLDDTLLRDDMTISPYTLAVLRKAADRGIRIIPASGRATASMRGYVREIGCAGCFISCNGAEVLLPDETLLRQALLSEELTRELAHFAQENHCYAQTYEGDYFFYNYEGEYARSYASTSKMQGRHIGDLEAYTHGPSTKLLMMDSPERIAELMAEVKRRWGGVASITCSKPYFLEVNPLEATKGIALAWCAEHFGFDMKNTMAFGDSLNDLSMLTAAGHGIAIGNARAEVKAVGLPLADTNENDGVARYIEQHVLGGAV